MDRVELCGGEPALGRLTQPPGILIDRLAARANISYSHCFRGFGSLVKAGGVGIRLKMENKTGIEKKVLWFFLSDLGETRVVGIQHVVDL